jgi:hypothetical protein
LPPSRPYFEGQYGSCVAAILTVETAILAQVVVILPDSADTWTDVIVILADIYHHPCAHTELLKLENGSGLLLASCSLLWLYLVFLLSVQGDPGSSLCICLCSTLCEQKIIIYFTNVY